MEHHLSTLMGEALFNNQAEAYKLYSLGKVSTAPIQTLGQLPLKELLGGPNAQTCVKTGYIEGATVFVIKVASGGARDGGNSGVMLVFSQQTLRLETMLLDEGILTEMRTAAASCLASRTLLGPARCGKINKIGIIGVGIQALWQLRFLSYITTCRTVVVKSRSITSARTFVNKMKTSTCALDRAWNIEIELDTAKIIKECNLIHTVTPSREPIISSVHTRREFLHITCVGADTIGKQELSNIVIAAADLLVCDSIAQCRERGEFQRLPDTAKIEELGAFLNHPKTLQNKHNFSIFDTTGMAAQDIMIACLVSSLVS